MPAGVADVPQVVVLAFVEVAEHPLEQDLGEADHGVQRRAQLVRHAREELRLVLAGDGQLAGSGGPAPGRAGRWSGRRRTGWRRPRAGRISRRRRRPAAGAAPRAPRPPGRRCAAARRPASATRRRGGSRGAGRGRPWRGPRSGTTMSRRRTGRPRSRRRGSARAAAGRGRLARPVCRSHPEQPGGLVVLHQGAAVGLGQLHRVADDRGEDLLDVEGGADRPCRPRRAPRAGRPCGRAPWSAGRYGARGRLGSRTSPVPRRSARRRVPPRSATRTGHRRRRRR